MISKKNNLISSKIDTKVQELDNSVRNKVSEVKRELHVKAVKENTPQRFKANQDVFFANLKIASSELKNWNKEVGFTKQLRDVLDLAFSGLNVFLQTAFQPKKEKEHK
ncbi:hypothetical protein [[Mycoplasma] testudinis]|uniref:hypothetical protein n=1 Tax=[Mycoplasma] testudinis TaxID=33924 RepID=UPI0004894F08|nr:hypothetical protein [[Mycoplasma] testudinis]